MENRIKVSYVKHCPGHKNSKGQAAPWYAINHESEGILSSFKGIRNITELLKIASSIFEQLQQKYSEEDILFAMKNDPSYDNLQNVDNLKEAKKIVNGKLGKFVKFILLHIEEIKSSYSDNITNIINEYLVARNSSKIDFNTPIEEFNSIQQLKEILDNYAFQINPIKDQKEFERQIKNINPEETEKFEIGNEFVVIHPNTAAESAYWGKETTWCTASRTLKGNYFNSYTEDGDEFYIIIDKTNNEKYGYATKTQELQDKTNHPMLKHLFTLDMLDRENGEDALQYLYNLTQREEFLERDQDTLFKNSVSEALENNNRNMEWYNKIPFQAVNNIIETVGRDPSLVFEEINKFRKVSKDNIEYTDEIVNSKIPEKYRGNYWKTVKELPKKPETYEESIKLLQGNFNKLIIRDENDNLFIQSYKLSMLLNSFDVVLEFPNIPLQGLIINGDLDLEGTPIQSLPEGLKVGGDLDLEGTPIQSLPEGLKVGGNLNLGGTPIQSLPEGLKVGGNLNLGGTPIQSLPEGLQVGGNLYLRETPIQSLPEGLIINGDLYLGGTPIQSLPEGLQVGGDLYLGGTPIQSLPEGLQVGGDLYLGGTPIQSLPEGLIINGDLYLRETPIQSLPEGLKVGGKIFGFEPKPKEEKLDFVGTPDINELIENKDSTHQKTNEEGENIENNMNTGIETSNKTASMNKISYIVHMEGHKNSKGEVAPYVIKSHETNKILSSHKTRGEAVKHLQQMHAHSSSFVGIQNLDHLILEKEV